MDLTGDLINIKYADYARVESCKLTGNEAIDTDAIDYDGISNGVIRNNEIKNFFGDNSDGIDLGEGANNVLIEGNQIINCADKGISVGQASTCQVSQNVIVGCNQGIGIKDTGSFADLDHNTFFANNYGIAVFEKNAGSGGGQVRVNNTCLSKSGEAALFADEFSEAEISYSLSDTDLLPGEGNIFSEPEFVNASMLNFELQDQSPCIDNGDPDSPLDADNTQTDIGAQFSFQGTATSDIIINELNYNAGDECDVADWIELYNRSNTETVDLSAWTIKSGLGCFEIPNDVSLGPNSYLVICRDLSNFQDYHPDANALGNFDFGLSNAGAAVKLLDPEGNIVNMVFYADDFPWPQGADAYCNTLELFDANTDNTVPLNWHSSFERYGTPGAANTTQTAITDLHINEFMAANELIADEAGEFDDWIELYNAGNTAVNIGGLFISDDYNEPLKWRIPRTNTATTTIEPGAYKVLWADRDLEQGVLHCNFRISAPGEELALYQYFPTEAVLLDSISFGPQTSTISYGQFGDGLGNWQFLQPSPNSTNLQLPTNTEDIHPLSGKLELYPNPTSTDITVVINEGTKVLYPTTYPVHIIDVFGRSVRQFLLQNQSPNRVDISSLPVGVYYLCVGLENRRLLSFVKI